MTSNQDAHLLVGSDHICDSFRQTATLSIELSTTWIFNARHVLGFDSPYLPHSFSVDQRHTKSIMALFPSKASARERLCYASCASTEAIVSPTNTLLCIFVWRVECAQLFQWSSKSSCPTHWLRLYEILIRWQSLQPTDIRLMKCQMSSLSNQKTCIVLVMTHSSHGLHRGSQAVWPVLQHTSSQCSQSSGGFHCLHWLSALTWSSDHAHFKHL